MSMINRSNVKHVNENKVCMEDGCDGDLYGKYYCRKHYLQIANVGNTYSFDIVGKKYGDLTVIEKTDQRTGYGRVLFRCKCKCGREHQATRWMLINKQVVRCSKCPHTSKHGECVGGQDNYSRDYRAWLSMKVAAKSSNVPICDRWSDYLTWLEDIGSKPERYCSFLRIDKEKGYEPGNVQWSSGEYQGMNIKEKFEAIPSCKAHGKRRCQVQDCEQRAYGEEDTMCYFHKKIVDGLIGAPHTYTECMDGPELILRRALSIPMNFTPLNPNGVWRM